MSDNKNEPSKAQVYASKIAVSLATMVAALREFGSPDRKAQTQAFVVCAIGKGITPEEFIEVANQHVLGGYGTNMPVASEFADRVIEWKRRPFKAVHMLDRNGAEWAVRPDEVEAHIGQGFSLPSNVKALPSMSAIDGIRDRLFEPPPARKYGIGRISNFLPDPKEADQAADREQVALDRHDLTGKTESVLGSTGDRNLSNFGDLQ